MAPYTIVYSPNPIRGEIIVKSLEANGVECRLYTDPFQAEDALKETSSPVIILDAIKNFASETALLRSAAFHLADRTLIVIADPTHFDMLESLGLRRPFFLDSMDPGLIVSIALENLRDPGRKPKRNNVHLEKTGEEIRAALTSARERVAVPRPGEKSAPRGASEPSPDRPLTRLGKTVKLFALSFLLTLFLVAGALGGYVYWCVASLPDVNSLTEITPFKTSKLYSYDNRPLAEFYVEKRTHIKLESIPLHVIRAFIAVEDKHYYTHGGIDFFRVVGALVANLKEWDYLQGGSTITQQLAKMVFLNPEKTITRKVQQIALSMRIEKQYSKDQILELYFNKAYFGAGAYGIEAASRAYFGKSVGDVRMSEAALLAGLPRAPSIYSPLKNPRVSMKRRNMVLKSMLEAGLIKEGGYRKLVLAPIPRSYHGPKSEAPYFVDFCRGRVEEKYGRRLYTSGLTIYSSLDSRMQKIVEEAVQNGVERMKTRGIDDVQVAVIVMDIKQGWIRAMVGGVNFEESQFNRATQAKRQPGSAFKPFVYLTALNQGMKVEDEIEDEKFVYLSKDKSTPWTPRNADRVYHGTVTLKEGLAHSYNAATVNLADKVTIGSIIETAHGLGIKSEIYDVYSSALGASELTLLELVAAYAAFDEGRRIEPVCIDRIIDHGRQSLIEPSGKGETVIKAAALSDIRKMLRAVVLEGTGRRARVLNRQVYGKTGTSTGGADALFIGFDDKFAVGVWVGRDRRDASGPGVGGSTTALPIWIECMRRIGELGDDKGETH